MTRSLIVLLATTTLMPVASVTAQGETLPTGGTVVAGQASIGAPQTSTLTITQGSGRAIINWQSFSIGEGNKVVVAQPNANAVLLNRVTGDTTSTLAGQLSANGQIFLINPNGILITKTGSVKAAGFVASTLDLANDKFMSGEIALAGDGGRVSNAGTISIDKGGYAALIGGQVDNAGLIVAPLGKVALGSGTRATLDLAGDGFLQVAVPATHDGGITLSGRISANGGNVLVTAATALDAARNVVNLSGESQALGVTGVSGNVSLTGSIHVDSATGNAGKIMVLGDSVNANGVLSARAVGPNGDGGAIETSGRTVNFAGLIVDTRAAHGRTGTWLIDPTDLTVDAAAAATISTNLATSNVTLQTNADGSTSGPGATSPGLGDIMVNSPVSWGSANALTLSAYHDVLVNAAITNSGGASVNLVADNTGTGSGTVAFAGAGQVSTAGAVNIFYNPTSNPFTATPAVNPGSYASADDFTPFVTGGATLTAYMLVNNVFDLQNINNNLNGSYAVGRDIDASATANWNAGSGAGGGFAGFIPLGGVGDGVTSGNGAETILNNGNGFAGILNGQSHTITGLFVNGDQFNSGGLFGYSGGTIMNIGLVGVSISADSHVGGLVGEQFIGTISQGYVTGTVSGNANVGGLVGMQLGGTISGSYATSTVNGAQNNVGGLVGSLSGGTITQSYATGTVSGNSFVGGLVGGQEDGTTISRSHATGTVLANGDSVYYYGGLVGAQDGGVITQCYATGNVVGYPTSEGVGGLVGGQAGTIDQSYATGTASGDARIGGLVGRQVGGATTRSYATGAASGNSLVGGLVGLQQGGTIDQTYATGTANGTNNVGGLVGEQDDGAISNSYATGAVTGVSLVGGLVGNQNGGTIDRTYAVGAVTGTNNVGGLVGEQDGGAVTASYWDTNTTGQPSGFGVNFDGGSGATGLTTLGMQDINIFDSPTHFASTPTSYLGWDFQAIWSPPNQAGQNGNPGNYYPQLYALSYVVAVAPGTSSTYGSPLAAQYYGLHSGDSISTPATLSGVSTVSPVGTYFITASGANSANPLYRYVYLPANDTVTPRALTIAPDALSRVYGNVNPASGTASGNNLVNGDTITSVSLTSPATTASNVGSYDLSGSSAAGTGLGNYTISYALLTNGLTVTPRALTITPDALSRVYGNANPASGTASGNNLVNGDTITSVSLATAATAASNVGSYDLSGSSAVGSGLGNYAINYALLTNGLTVTPRALTITPDAQSRVYGNANPGSGTASGNNLVNGDTITAVSLVSPATTASNVGAYDLSGSSAVGSGLGNYAINYATLTNGLTVTPRALTITPDALSRVYGNANPPLTYAVGGMGLVNGDTITTVSLVSPATTASNVGSYDLSGSNAAGTGLGNYAISYALLTNGLTVTPRALTITPDAQSRVYGNPNPTSGTASGNDLVNGDTITTVSLATTATTASNVGAYDLSGSSAVGSGLGNYAINYALLTNGLTVIPRALTITPDAQSRVYGNANPGSGTASGNNLVNGDTITSVSLATAATTASSVGAYDLSGSNAAGTGLSNYTISYALLTNGLTVTPRALTITPDAVSRAFGNPNPPLTYAVGGMGLANGDGLNGSLATNATVTSVIGNYAITQGSLAASKNYVMTYVPGTLTVVPRSQVPGQNFASTLWRDSWATAGLPFAGLASLIVNDDAPNIVWYTSEVDRPKPVTICLSRYPCAR